MVSNNGFMIHVSLTMKYDQSFVTNVMTGWFNMMSDNQ